MLIDICRRKGPVYSLTCGQSSVKPRVIDVVQSLCCCIQTHPSAWSEWGAAVQTSDSDNWKSVQLTRCQGPSSWDASGAAFALSSDMLYLHCSPPA